MKGDPQLRALADLIVAIVLRESTNADRKQRKELLSDGNQKKENAPEGALSHEITTKPV